MWETSQKSAENLLTRSSTASCRIPYNFSLSKSFYKSRKKNILYAMPSKTKQRNSIESVHRKPLP